MNIKLDREIQAKYEVLAIMGEGGMGAVYKVRHRYLDEIQVIKTVRERFQADEELKVRFLREAKTAKRLRHPNIAEVIDYSVTREGTAFIVMEFIEGVNLREVMTRAGGVLDAQFVVEIGLQTLAALGYLHGKGFVHRDISPDNLMLSKIDGTRVIKLIDLGIAKPLAATSNLTADGRFVGKMRYASPEQFGEREIDQRSDLYSLGVVLYELATGIAPIGGSDHRAMIAGHLTRPPRPFDETDPKGLVPTQLREVILRALRKDRADRYQTAEAFSVALQPISTEHDATSTHAEFPLRQEEGRDLPSTTTEVTVSEVSDRETREVDPATVPIVAMPGAATTMTPSTSVAAVTTAPVGRIGRGGRSRRWVIATILAGILLALSATAIHIRKQAQSRQEYTRAVEQPPQASGATLTVLQDASLPSTTARVSSPQPGLPANQTASATLTGQGEPTLTGGRHHVPAEIAQVDDTPREKITVMLRGTVRNVDANQRTIEIIDSEGKKNVIEYDVSTNNVIEYDVNTRVAHDRGLRRGDVVEVELRNTDANHAHAQRITLIQPVLTATEQKDCDFITTSTNGFRAKHNYTVHNNLSCEVTYTIANVTKATRGNTQFESDKLAYNGTIAKDQTAELGYLSFITNKCEVGEADSSIEVTERGSCGTDTSTYRFHTNFCTNCAK